MKHLATQKLSRVVVVTATLGTLAACSSEIGYGPSFHQEAGTQLDFGGEFGNVTLHNQLVQTCRTNGVGYKAGGKSGVTAGDPVVVLDPSSTVNRPVYRVYCDGRLDGKYAIANYGSYIGSSSEDQTVSEADGG